HTLTKEETNYYNEVIDNDGFAGVEKLVPKTVINRVFEDLVKRHPLLQEITFVNTTGVTQWVVKKGEVNPAFWGKLCDDIKEKIDEGFETIDMNLYKLSAFLPVCNAMLELGPEWLDRYIRAVLGEAMSIGLEEAIIAGTGKDQPIGMTKDLNGGTNGEGEYQDKEAVALADFTIESLYGIRADLSNGGERSVGQVLLVVNPNDYNRKIAPAFTFLTAGGQFVYNMPIDAKVIESNAVEEGTMIAGLAKNYFLGVGSEQKILVSKEVRFIEDETVYLTRMLANGRAQDITSFIVYDISGAEDGEPTP